MRRSSSAWFVFALSACGAFGSDEETPPPVEPGPEAPPPLGGTPVEDELTEKYGVFVMADGPSDADGSRAKPFATIAGGLERAVATSRRLYVCAGTFREAVKVARGVSMVGGLDCSTPVWAIGEGRTRIEAPTSPAVLAENVDAPTRFERFEVIAPDAAQPGGSSIGLLAKKAGAFVVAKSRIQAGAGRAGADGKDAALLASATTVNGGASVAESTFVPTAFNTAAPSPGGPGGTNTCLGAAGFVGEAGGKGGSGGAYDCEYNASTSAYQWVAATGPGGLRYLPGAGDATRTGAPGEAGTDGASAAESGKLTVDGYVPADGTPGRHGSPGKGGKGGNGGGMTSPFCSQNTVGESASGPGGGAGGCPGLAGTPGKGGGASIAALVSNSEGLTFDASELFAGPGGKGGRGSFGSSPTAGGAPGGLSGKATAATAGGPGGRAGVSGAGAGGPSIALAHTGGAPKQTNGTRLMAGPVGAGVAPETASDALGNAKTIAASAAGESKPERAF